MEKAMQDHLKKVHETMAAHHAGMGEACSKLADSFGESAEDDSNPSSSQHSRDRAEVCKAMGREHASAGSFHLDCFKSVDSMKTNEGGANGSSELKAILDRLDKMSGMPAGVSAVPRFDAPRTLVPRAGQPRVEDHDTESAKAAVDPALKDVIFDPRQAIG